MSRGRHNARMKLDDIQLNDLELTPAERAGVEQIAERLNATVMSCYRRSDGLFAFVVDAGGGEHHGVRIPAGDHLAMADVDRPEKRRKRKRPGARH